MGKKVSSRTSTFVPPDSGLREVKVDRFGKVVSWFRGDSNSKHAKNAKRFLAVFISAVLCATIVGIIPVAFAGVKWRNLSRRETQVPIDPVVENIQELVNSFVILKPTSKEKREQIAVWVEKYNSGDVDALKALKEFAKQQLTVNAAIAHEAYQKAAELGDGEALAIRGDWLRKKYAGKEPTEEELDKGLEYIEKSAKQKHPLGLYYLAKYYEGTISDSVKAKKYYKKAVKKGSVESMARLGNAYEYGHLGFKKNLKKALKYYKMGKERDDFVCTDGVTRLEKNSSSPSQN